MRLALGPDTLDPLSDRWVRALARWGGARALLWAGHELARRRLEVPLPAGAPVGLRRLVAFVSTGPYPSADDRSDMVHLTLLARPAPHDLAPRPRWCWDDALHDATWPFDGAEIVRALSPAPPPREANERTRRLWSAAHATVGGPPPTPHRAGELASPGTLEMWGLWGHPTHRRSAIASLHAAVIDPALGFTTRWAAAIALGRIGDPRSTGPLLQAASFERRRWMGRPGAGLGVQRPVLTAITWALGELEHPAAVPWLLDALSDPAIPTADVASALWKHAPISRAALLAHVRQDRPGAMAVAALLGAGAHAAPTVDPRPWTASCRSAFDASRELADRR